MNDDHTHATINRLGMIEGLRVLRQYLEEGNIEFAKIYLDDLATELKLDQIFEEAVQ